MFILSHNPSVPRSCPSVQVSAASDLPVHHEVAFVQLWPHLLSRAALTQPLFRQNEPLLRSPWQPWLVTPRLLTSTPPVSTTPRHPPPHPPLDSHPSQTPIAASPVLIWILGAALDAGWSLDLGQIPPENNPQRQAGRCEAATGPR